ncbi:unnamed protein product [Soboliphyme baturini]|uniref:Transposase n=1 Tax=Soboliphyme baturini TaxID=241478 RepID=A0A183IND0_9BILA|nr:unnamed protein product [Soboliphyme baturini]
MVTFQANSRGNLSMDSNAAADRLVSRVVERLQPMCLGACLPTIYELRGGDQSGNGKKRPLRRSLVWFVKWCAPHDTSVQWPGRYRQRLFVAEDERPSRRLTDQAIMVDGRNFERTGRNRVYTIERARFAPWSLLALKWCRETTSTTTTTINDRAARRGAAE